MKRLAVAVVVVVVVGGLGCSPDFVESPGLEPPIESGRPPAADQHALEISGGTVQIAGNGQFAAVVDADRALVWIVDLRTLTVRGTAQLPKGSAPGRMALDSVGDLYVALRATGDVAKISVPSGDIVSTRHACGDPRGLTWDPYAQLMRIACADGTLASLPQSGEATAQHVRPDLRDVLITDTGLLALTWRSAQLWPVGVAKPQPIDLPKAGISNGVDAIAMVPHTAWRGFTAPDGSLIVVHQRVVDGPVESLHSSAANVAAVNTSTNGAYSDTTAQCATPVVRSSLTVLPPAGAANPVPRFVEVPGVLPVDAAVSPDSHEVSVALAGSNFVERMPLQGQNTLSLCAPQPSGQAVTVPMPDGVAYTPTGTLVIHSHTPSGLVVVEKDGTQRSMVLDARPFIDPGQAFFHTPVNGIACASCHPEGRDDGHVWNIAGERRRTPPLAGGLLATAPFHWQGELADMPAVVGETFVHRMGGAMPESSTVDSLGRWLDTLPSPAPTLAMDLKDYQQAKQLFESPAVGCATCHAGPTLTSGQTVDVGTGQAFQVPSLRGVGQRAPYMHDGRASSLRDRFGPTGGTTHGNTAQLDGHQIDLLVGYLETL
jgi:hypothetical protein